MFQHMLSPVKIYNPWHASYKRLYRLKILAVL